MNGTDAQQTSTRNLLGLLPALVVIIAGAASLFFQLFVFPADTSADDWREPAHYVVDQLSEDDIIRVHPAWTEAPLPYLTDVDHHVQRQSHPVLGDFDEPDDVWLITETDRLEEGIRRLPFEVPLPLAEDRIKRFGPVSVARISFPDDAGFSWEALENLADAEVTRVDPKADKASAQRCQNWNERELRWDCGARDKWLYVGRELRVIGGDPRECIWAHPLPDGKTLRVEFPEAPLEENLRVRAGLDYKGATSTKVTDVRFRVFVDGEERWRHTYPATESSWDARDIDTSNLRGQRKSIAFEVESDKVKNRYFCFNAWTSAPRPDPDDVEDDEMP